MDAPTKFLQYTTPLEKLYTRRGYIYLVNRLLEEFTISYAHLIFRSMRIGKILVDSEPETHEAHVVFAKLPDDISNRKSLKCLTLITT